METNVGSNPAGPALAVDSNGKAHIAYRYTDFFRLRYVTNESGSWITNAVDNTANLGWAWTIDMALDYDGKAHISYLDCNSGCGDQNDDILYTSNFLGSWVYDTLDRGDLEQSAIAVDLANTPHVGFYNSPGNDMIYTTNASGPWNAQIINSSGGGSISMDMDSSEKLHISFYNSTGGQLMYITNATGSWVPEYVAEGGASTSDATIAVDSSGYAHIAYRYSTGVTSDIMYATNSTGSWVISMVESTITSGVIPSIAVDSSGKAHISYSDTTSGSNLRYATNSSGSWVMNTVDSTSTDEVWSDIAVGSDGSIQIAYSLNTGSTHDLKHASKDGGADTTPPNILWTVQPGTSSADFANSVAVDSSGNAYVTGSTQGALDGNTNSGGSDIFLTKYDSSGNRLWTVQPGTSSWDKGQGVAVDGSGNVYVTGSTEGALDGNTNSGGPDIILTKYDSNGNRLWTVQPGTSSSEQGSGVAVDSSGNAYVTGYTWGALDGNTKTGFHDIFLTKYDSSGNRLWTVQHGTSASDYGEGVAVDASGNAYVTGWTHGALDGNTNLGGRDIFLTKYDTGGNRLWTVQQGTSSWDGGQGVAVDGSGNAFVTGETYGALDGNTSSGGRDIFLTKYDSSGNRLWTMQPGTSGIYDVGYGVTVDASGNIYIAGNTDGALNGNTNSGFVDIFLMKLGSGGGGSDTTPPETTIDSQPSNPSVSNSPSFSFSSTEGGSTFTCQMDGGGYSSCTSPKVYNGLSDGSHTFFVNATDLSGNTDLTPASHTWTIDTTAPNTSITSQPSSLTNSTSASFTFNSTEAGTFNCQMDAGGYSSCTSPKAYAGLSEDSHTFFVNATDAAGNTDLTPASYTWIINTSLPNALWTKQFGTSSWDVANAVAVDGSGNVYVTGYTEGALDGNTNSGSYDIILTKYDSSGSRLWTVQPGTSGDDRGFAVAVDANGNAYVTGFTLGALDGNTNSGNTDIFLTKYDSSGSRLWTVQPGTSSWESGEGVAVDASGNAFVTGYTQGALDGNTNSGNNDIFLTKYDSSGSRLWTVQPGTSSGDTGISVAVDGSGNAFVTGWTAGALDGNTNSGGIDIFLTKYDSSGSRLWTVQPGTSGWERGISVAVDGSGNAYVTGETTGALDGNTNSGLWDTFLTKYDTSGNRLWTVQPGTSGDDYGYGVAVDGSGNAFVTGRTWGALDGNSNFGAFDIILTKYDSSGNRLWTMQPGTSGTDIGYGVAVDGSGNAYVTGYTSGGLNGNTNSGGYDIFLMKIGSGGGSDTTPPDTSITSQPASLTNSTSASFIFNSTEAGSTFTCQMDAGGYSSCTSPKAYSGLSEGSHTFFVNATDTSGNTDLTPASYTWTVDTIAPTTSIDSQPPDPSISNSPSFTFSGSDGGSGVAIYECQMDAGGYSSCTSPKVYNGLSDGSHTFYVKATDIANNTDLTPASYTWTIDTSLPASEWTVQTGASDYDTGFGVAVDGSGNTYVTGYTEGALDGNTNSGGADIFLTKYDINGSRLWTVQPGTSDYDTGFDVAVDGSGNAYVTGYTEGALDGNTNSGGADIILTKYDSSGNRLWTVQPGTSGEDNGWGVAVDGSGAAYVIGETFGALDGNTNSGTYDIFLTKYDTSGNRLWTVQPGTTSDDQGWGVAVDGSGNVYATGYTQGALHGNTNSGGADIFLTKYNASGNRLWTVQQGTASADQSFDVALDTSGNAYIAGVTTGALDGNTNSGGYDIFLTKYDSSGNRLWTVQPGTSGDDYGSRVAVDGSGNAYVSGYTNGGLDGNSNLGNQDIILTKYDTSGNRQWTIQQGTSGVDFGEGVAVDGSGNAYVTGSTNGALNGNSNMGGYDIFLMKIGSGGSDTIPPNTSIASQPASLTNSTSASFIFNSTEAGSTFNCQMDAGGYSSCTSPKAYSGLSDASHTFYVNATDSSSNTDLTPASYTWTVDTVAPTTSIDSQPSDPDNSDSPSFTFSGTDGGSGVASYECQMDGGGYSSCTSPKAYSGLSDASHTFYVRAIDNASNTDASPASYTWTIDATPPDTSITSQPSNPSNNSIVSFSFTSTEGGSTFNCQMDAGGYSSCTSPKVYNGVSEGSHTFFVNSTDTAGNTDLTPASYTWTVNDTTAPTTTASPTGGTYQVKMFVSLSANEAATIYYTTDGSTPTTSSSVYGSAILIDTTKTLKFFARDVVGNEETVKSETYIIDHVPDWIVQPGTSNYDQGEGVAVDGSGNAYVTGYTWGGLDGNTSSGTQDIFLTKYDSSGNRLWTVQPGTSASDLGEGVAVDGSGNAYVTGYTYSGNYDIFLTKYDSSGNRLWIVQPGASGGDFGYDVAVDGSGNAYVTGWTNGSLDGNISSGGADIILTKYDSSGNRLWTVQPGTSASDYGKGVAVDGSGNAYVTGYTYGALDGNTNSGGWDIFLTKYDSSGNRLWTVQPGTSGNDQGKGVAVDGSGNAYVTGHTWGGLDGNTSSGNWDIFLTKYDSSGNRLWTVQPGTSGNDQGKGVAVDGSGNAYVTGYTGGGLDGNTNSGGTDIFLTKYDSSGNKLWTVQPGTSSWDEGYGVAVDGSGDAYITGPTEGALDGNTNSGFSDIFLMKIGSGGGGSDTTPPNTSITSQPSSLTNSTSASFIFNSTEAGSTFTCQMDAGGYSSCTSPKAYAGLSEGSHTFFVNATDSVGNTDLTPASYTWTIDTTAPNTSITSQPPSLTNSTSASFVFDSTEAGTFNCQLDAGGYSSCTSAKAYAGLSEGSHTFFVNATDLSGNTDLTPASYTWTINTALPDTLWTVQPGTSGYDYGYGVVVDASGNVYVTGCTRGGLDGNTNSGGCDIFLTKYDSSGNRLWTKQLGSSASDFGEGVAVDGSGNAYVTGHTYGALDGNTNSGLGDIFLTKYDSSGNRLWTVQPGTSGEDYGRGVAVDGSGNAYVTGETWGGLDGNTNSGVADIFLTKYDAGGNRLWTVQLGTSSWDYGSDVAVDGSGNSYVTGSTSGGLDGNTYSGGNRDIFLTKYDSSGNRLWTVQPGTSGTEEGYSVAVDGSGNAYVTGYTSGGLDGNTNSGSGDIFLTKYDSSGNRLWTVQPGSSFGEVGYGVVVDASGNVYVTGCTGGGLDGNTNSGGGCDIFLTKYDSSGNRLWTVQSGTTGQDTGRGVAVDASGNAYVTGYTGGGLEGNTNSGEGDIFLMKFGSGGGGSDTTPPDTSITSQPTDPDNSDSPSFIFNSTEAGSTFNCQMDAGGYSSCTSPKAYAGLSDGSHTFYVNATDSAGNTDLTPASYTWTIDATAPTTSIDSQPSNPSVSNSPSFTFSGTDGGSGVASYECRMDAGGYSSCTSPKAYAGLSDASHTFYVRAIDNAGNMDATPASYTWTVDATAPTTTADLAAGTYLLKMWVTLSSNDGGATIYYTTDGSTPTTSSSVYNSAILIDSTKTLKFFARDAVGNDETVNSVAYTINRALLWTVQPGASGGDHGQGVAFDGSGNAYVTGYTYGAFDGNTSSGGQDIFLTKYDTSGNRLWTVQSGTTGQDLGRGVAVDGSGNAYVTGGTDGALNGNTNSGSYDIFLTKYDDSGNRLWTVQPGTSGDDKGAGVAVDTSGNTYVTGYTNGALNGNTNSGSYDIFLTKYDDSGNRLWTVQPGTSDIDSGAGVTVDGSGNAYVTGHTYGGLDGNTSSGGPDIFLTKYDASGNRQWTVQLGTTSNDIPKGVAVDGSGNAYVTGSTLGGLDGNINSGFNDIFLTKYDSSGNRLWTVQPGTSKHDYGDDVAVDGSGNAYVTGWTWGGLDGNTNSGGYDIFLTKYDSSGNRLRTVQPGTSGTDYGYDVAVDASGNAYVTGSTYGALDGNTNSGGADIFLMKFDYSAPVSNATPAGGIYNAPMSVTLSCDDGTGSGCDKTYYCTGAGCTPTTEYSSALNLTSDTVLRFYSTDNAGNTEAINTETYNLPPARPNNISVESKGDAGELEVNWTKPSDSDFDFVRIYRSTSQGVLGSMVANSLTGMAYTDTGLSSGMYYCYTVRSVDTAGIESANSNSDANEHGAYPCATTSDSAPPSAPTGISATDAGTGGAIDLGWTNPGDSDLSHVHIYRSIINGVIGTLVHDDVSGTSKQDTGLTNGQTYYYTFRSVDTDGNESANTNQASASPTAPDSTPPATVANVSITDPQTGGTLDLAWDNPADGDFSMTRIYRTTTDCPASPDADQTGTIVHSTVSNSVSDTGLTDNVTYCYEFHTVDTLGNESTHNTQYSGTPTDAQAPEPVKDLTATPLVNGVVRLDWVRSPSSDINYYNVYSDNSTGTMYYANAPLANTVAHPTVTWTSEALTVGNRYLFGVRAEDEALNEETNTNVVVSIVPVADPNAGNVSARIKSPKAGRRVKGTKVSVLGELVIGTAAMTNSMEFDYKPVASGTWTDLAEDLTLPYRYQWDVSGLADGDYHLRAVAVNATTYTKDANPPHITIAVDSANPHSEETESGGEKTKKEKVDKNADSNVFMADSVGITIVNVPEGALSGDTLIIITEKEASSQAYLVTGNYESGGQFRDISFQSGQAELSNAATIVIPYVDDNDDNIVDGTDINVFSLKICNYHNSAWTCLDSFIDTTKKVIWAESTQFSLFGLLEPPVMAGQGWSFLSVPLTPVPANPMAVWGAPSSYVSAWNPAGGYFNPSTIEAGVGYWLNSSTNRALADISGTETLASDFSITIKQGWNAIGNPFRYSVNVSDLSVDCSGTVKTITDAATAGWIIATVYSYENGSYQNESAQDSGKMDAWKGYWLLSDVDCSLVVPAR